MAHDMEVELLLLAESSPFYIDLRRNYRSGLRDLDWQIKWKYEGERYVNYSVVAFEIFKLSLFITSLNSSQVVTDLITVMLTIESERIYEEPDRYSRRGSYSQYWLTKLEKEDEDIRFCCSTKLGLKQKKAGERAGKYSAG